MLTLAVYSLDLPAYACARLRLLGPARALAGRLELRWAARSDGRNYAIEARAMEGADLIVFQRYFPMAATWPLVEKALNSGLPVVYETDDDFLNVPGDHPMRQRLEPVRPFARELAARASLVTVSTSALADSLKGLARRTAVLPNCLEGDLWGLDGPGGGLDTAAGVSSREEPSERAHQATALGSGPVSLEASRQGARSGGAARPVRIVYAGTASHGRDLALILPALQAVGRRFGPGVEFVFLGQAPHGFQAQAFDEDYAAYAARLRALTPDIALAPLEDTPFNRTKSAVKWLEYAAAGAAGVFSDLPPYAPVRQGRTGLKAGPDWREWEQALVRLVEDRQLRRALAGTARREVADRWTTSGRAERFLGVWREAARGGR